MQHLKTIFNALQYWVFPILCLAGSLTVLAWREHLVQRQKNAPPLEVREGAFVSKEEYQAAAQKLTAALREKSDEEHFQQQLELARIADKLQEELLKQDEAFAAQAATDINLQDEDFRREHQAFVARMEAQGIKQEVLADQKLENWRSERNRVITYSTRATNNLETLHEDVKTAMKTDPEVEIRTRVKSATMAFLTTYERPWRIYVQDKVQRGNNGGDYLMLLAGRVVVGYDMTEVEFKKRLDASGEVLSYIVMLPKPKIKEVIFDFDKTRILRMDTTAKLTFKTFWEGAQIFHRQLFQQTNANKVKFLKDFSAHRIFDPAITKDNLRNVLSQYFELQGNEVDIEIPSCTFEEMVEEYLETLSENASGTLGRYQ